METDGEGVFYRSEDYLGLVKRLVIDVIDVPIAMTLAIAAIFLAQWAAPTVLTPGLALVIFWAVWLSYFVLLRRSSIRTPGYVVAGARVVNLRGERPDLLCLAIRAAFLLVGPVNLIVDFLWLTGDANRQTIRDKYAGTYVIRAAATPAGTGPVAYRSYMLMGMSFLFREVARRPA